MVSRSSGRGQGGRKGRARSNQRLRTRKDLLQAAARLVRQGDRTPTLEEVAAEALVSRATAYRYFASVEELLVEAPLDAEVPEPEALFADVTSEDAEERIDLAEAALHEMVYANRAQLKLLLANSLRAGARAGARDGQGPVRQNRRLGLIEAALAPERSRFGREAHDRLCAGLALVFGIESMVVLTDVLPTSPREARRIKSWVVRALVRAARGEAGQRKRPGRRPRSGSSGR